MSNRLLALFPTLLLTAAAFGQTPTKTVRSIYLVPTDAARNDRQALVQSAVAEIQQNWAQYGATFVAEPVETLVSTHDTNWFLNHPDGIWNSTDWNWLGNSMNEIVAHTYLQSNDPNHRIIVFLEVDVGGYCPCAAAAGLGFAGMPKWIIDRIEQGFPAETGAIGHELGHTFGMPHEDCAAQCEPRGVMCNGTSTDGCGQTTSYPNVALFDWHYAYLFQPQFVEYFVESTSNCIFDLAQVPDTEDEAGPYAVDVSYLPSGGASSVNLRYRAGGGAWSTLAMADLGGGNFRAEIPGQDSIQAVEYYVEAQSLSGIAHTYPVGGAANARSFVVARKVVSHEDDLETATNWTVVDTGVTSGSWVRVDPLGTSSGGEPVAPSDDHTPGGSFCFVTGQGTGAGASEADVDGGPTVLTSPALNLGGRDALIEFSYWFDSDNDSLLVEAARTGQPTATWATVRVITDADNRSCSGSGDAPAWRRFSFRVGEFFDPAGATRLRFTVKDDPDDSITEAAIDDIRVTKLFEVIDSCDTIERYCTATPNTTGFPASIGSSGTTSIAANDLVLFVFDIPNNSGIFITSPDQVEVPLGNGTVCIGSSTLGFVRRLAPSFFGVGNSASVALDHTDTVVPELMVQPGSTWNYQSWFRDLAGAGFDFSDALSVTYCP